jgi:hypothetical protein
MKTLQHKRGTAAVLTANNPTIPAGEIVVETDTGRIKIGDGSTAWTSLGYFVPASADIITAAALAASKNQATSVLDVVDRSFVNTTRVPNSGTAFFSFFTPAYSLSVSSISYATASTPASGLTLARFGLYSWDGTTLTLLARSASDTSLFAASTTIYQRNFDTAGGFPSSYTLVAGTRYAVGVLLVGTTVGNLLAYTTPNTLCALNPRTQIIKASLTDLPTTANSFSGTSDAFPWARLS